MSTMKRGAENIWLRLRYARHPHASFSDRCELWVLSQDKRATFPFYASNGWIIKSDSYPEVRDRVLYVRGTHSELDTIKLYCKQSVLCEIAAAVAEYNGRKNVAEIHDEGVIV